MTLGSLAFGLDFSSSITLSTNFAKGGSTGGNGYSGIAFQLTPKTDRYIGSDLLTKDATYELTSIAIQWRNDSATTKIGNGVHLVVTDASDLEVLGISDNVSAWQSVEIGGTSLISVVTNTFEEPVSLTLGTSYYAFYVADANVQDIEVGQPLTASVASVNLMAQGNNPSPYQGDAQDFSFTKGTASDSPNFAPRGALSITKKGSVPEPTTGTLSLLALAGLCIRRRK